MVHSHGIVADQVGEVGPSCEYLSRAAGAFKPERAHDASVLIPPDQPPLLAHHCMHLPHPMEAVVLLMQASDLGAQEVVTDRTRGRWPGLGRPVSAGGEKPTLGSAPSLVDI